MRRRETGWMDGDGGEIRSHSRFRSMSEVIRLTAESFASHAPPESSLLIKVHPLDNGLVNFRRIAQDIISDLGIGDRVIVIDGGHLPTILAHAEGVVTVNSTTGLQALHHGCRLKALGQAIFDMPGLTFQGKLDAFWRDDTKPDASLYRALRSVVIATAQVNGNFFTDDGMAMAVDGVLKRLAINTVTAPAMAAAADMTSHAEVRSSKPVPIVS